MSGQTNEEWRVPLVQIDVNQGRSPEQLTAISQGIHDATLAEYGIPERDYFQVGYVENTALDWPSMRLTARALGPPVSCCKYVSTNL